MIALPTIARLLLGVVLTIALLCPGTTAMANRGEAIAASPNNQAHQTLALDAPLDTVFPAAQQAFTDWSRGELLATDPDTRTITGLSRTNVFKFVDDITVHLAAGDSADTTELAIDSVGRMGESDFGGNQRNIDEYVETLKALL